MFGGNSDLLSGALVLPAAAFAGLVVVLLGGEAWLVLVAGGAGLAGLGAYWLWHARQSQRWTRTTGVIESSTISEYSVAVSKISRQTYFFPEVVFTYTAHGRPFSSTRAALDTRSIWSPDKKFIERMVQQFPPGAEVSVYVRPGKPDVAVIFPGLSAHRRSHYLALLVAGILLAALGYGVHVLNSA